MKKGFLLKNLEIVCNISNYKKKLPLGNVLSHFVILLHKLQQIPTVDGDQSVRFYSSSVSVTYID